MSDTLELDLSKSVIDASAETKRLVGNNIVTGYGTHEIIHDVSVQAHDGVTCIFGPNGSGKSTLMKSLNGILPVWSGEVTYGGTDLTGLSPADIVEEGIVTLPQDGGLFPDLTVRENLKIGGYTVSDKSVVKERRDDVLEAFPPLEEQLGAKTKSLSGGQQMMLAFARSMMIGADTFLLDEPSAGLAPSLVDDVFGMIEQLTEFGAQVILIEQNVRAALKIADYVYILAQGELQFEGVPEDLSDEDELIELYLGIV